MKRALQTAIVILCGLPGAAFLMVTVLDRIGRSPTSSDTRDLLIAVGFLAGPGGLILIPSMWIAFRFAARSLSRPSKWGLAAYAILSTLGAVDFWTQFFN